MSVFDEAKDSVTILDAVKLYIGEPNRAGFICCPFHHEKTPSMKLYDRNFHCFGCGAGGDVIDFVKMLFNLDPLEAVKKLNDDFRLGLPLDRPEDREEIEKRRRTQQAQKLFEEWKEELLLQLNSSIRVANLADFPKLSPEERTAVVYREALIAWADALQHGSLDEQMQIFRDREGVEKLCRMILNDTQKKSTAA